MDGGFVEVLRPCGQAACSELEACGGVEAVRSACPQRDGGFVEVEAVRAGCPQQVGGFVEVLRQVLRPCGQAVRLEALWWC